MVLAMRLWEVSSFCYPACKGCEKNVLFVLGFISQLLQGRPIEVCVRCGIWAATQVIQQDGCTLPANLDVPQEFRAL